MKHQTTASKKLYPVANGLSVIPPRNDIMAEGTGEYRCPMKGEYYLSGAIVEAWKAPNDLTSPYWIAKRVRVERVEVVSVYEYLD